MKIEIIRHPNLEDWKRCKHLALATVNKKFTKVPEEAWKQQILASEHSPIRTLMFTIAMEIPYYSSVHFVRHKHGVEHYVSSQRNDRQSNYDRTKAPQDAPVLHIMDINAQALITMAHKRLCAQADPVTNYIMHQIVTKIFETNPEFKGVLVPNCVYRGGRCTEFKKCGEKY